MRSAGKTALTILLCGLLWIWLSDYLVHSPSDPSEPYPFVDSIKGSFFVLALSFLVYVLVRRYQIATLNSEKSYKTLYTQSPSPVLICSKNEMKILDANEQAIKLLGYSLNELKAKSFFELRAKKSTDSISSIERILSKNGAQIIVQIRTSQASQMAKPVIMVSLNDVTETEELKQILIQRERMLDSLLKSENAFMIRIDLNGHYSFVNEAFTKVFKGVSDDFSKVHYSQTVHPDDVKKCEAAAARAVENQGQLIPVKLRKHIGNQNYLSTSWEFLATVDEIGQINGVQAVGRDSSDVENHKKAEQQSKAQLSMLLDSIQDGFFILGENLNIKLANHKFAELLDLPLDSIIERRIEDVFPNFQNTRSSIELPAAVENKSSAAFEAYNPFFDKWFSVSAYPFEEGVAVFYRDITEQKERDLEVKISEANLKSLINTTRDFIWSVDTELRILTANTSVSAIFEKMIGHPVSKRDSAVPVDGNPAVNDKLRPLYKKALAGFHVEETLDFQEFADMGFLVDVRMSPIRDKEDNIHGAACFARDITEVEKQRRELINSIERYTTLAAVTQDAIWEFEVDKDKIDWSIGLSSTFGYNEQTTTLDWWAKSLHPEDLDRVRNSLDAAIASSDNHWVEEYRFLHNNGSYRWVIDRGIVIRDQNGEALKMIGSMQDITVLKESLSEVRKLSLVAERTSSGVLITDTRANIEWCNEAYEKLSGYTLEEMKGKTPAELLHGPDTDPAEVAKIFNALQNNEGVTAELVSYRKDGTKYWTRTSITPVIQDGKVTRFISLETDISEERKVAERLQSQNKNLREIAFILSHELRKPVSSILGLLALYDAEDPSGRMNKDVIKYLQTATTELDEMVHEIIKQTALIDD